jgi:hypothetical protein
MLWGGCQGITSIDCAIGEMGYNVDRFCVALSVLIVDRLTTDLDSRSLDRAKLSAIATLP